MAACGQGRQLDDFLIRSSQAAATSRGFTAKAIALLKRVEKLEPRRADIKNRLKSLVHENGRPDASADTGFPDAFRPIRP